MKRFAAVVALPMIFAILAMFPAGSQTPPQAPGKAPNAAKKERPPENLPWDRFRPASKQPYQPTAAEKQQIQAKVDQLGSIIRGLQDRRADDDLLADVQVYHQAARWIQEFPEEFFNKDFVKHTLAVLDEGLERARQLQQGKSPWTTAKGRVVRGYRSAVDGSVQPYRVFIPDSYDGSRAVPLYVNLHGRYVTIYEISFIATPRDLSPAPSPDWIQLEVFGRGNNTYHWPGEADVYEAMASMERRYKIDPNRKALRGFSMGGAAMWHFALHAPDHWASIEIGEGDGASHRIPILNQLPPYQQAMTRIFDNMPEWALNAFNAPTIFFTGEISRNAYKHFQARDEFLKAGYHFQGDPFTGQRGTELPNLMILVARGVGHERPPEYRDIMAAFHREQVPKGKRSPDEVRLVTFTTRYNRMHWLAVDGMGKHYERAEVQAKRSDNRAQYDIATRNVTHLVLRETDRATGISIDGQKLSVKSAPQLALAKSNGKWQMAGSREQELRKRHALQGPIDDAFLAEPFLIVRPTGVPWNPAAHEQAMRILQRFERQYKLAYRALLPVKDDSDVTEADFAKYHVVLFGDPGSNRWIARLNGKLPVRWTKETVALGSKTFAASESVPAFVYPNPLRPSRYVVINSGLTAAWADWAGDFPTPRYGDFVIFKVKEGADDPEPLYAGLFDESWKLP